MTNEGVSRETRNEITEVTAATQAPISQRADCQEVMANLHEAKKGRRRCRTSFQLSTFPSSNAFDCVQSSKFQQSEELRTSRKPREDLALGLSAMVHLGRVGGLRSTRSGGTGNIGTRRGFTSLSNFSQSLRTSLAQHGNVHRSDGCVNSTPTTAATHAHFSRPYMAQD